MVSVPCQHIYKVLIVIVLALLLIEYTLTVLNESPNLHPLFSINYTSPFMSSSVVFYNLTTQRNESFGNNTVFCPVIPPNLQGPLLVNKTPISSLEIVEKKLESLELDLGGSHHPKDCTALFKVAIIVAYRDRAPHLNMFLYNLHPILARQQLDYTIFIVEQEGTRPFNRAMLFNVGFTEASKAQNFDCFIFHDVDLIPEDDRNLYTCPGMPRHMSVAVDVMNYRLPYLTLFGGVCALSRDQFELVNGFSNEYWGWGGEDDDMSNRIKASGLHIIRYPPDIARYTMLKHHKEKANPNRYEKLYSGHKRYKSDGLNNLQYKVRAVVRNRLFTWLLVHLGSVS